jgi:AAA family ATP:ADP antiporter
MVLLPVLALIRTAKIAEKSLDYSLESTTVNTLFLVVSRDAKYKAKAVIDTFLVRAGDVCAALAIWVGIHAGWRPRGFAALNVLLTAVWLLVAWRIRALHHARSEAPAAAPAPGARAVAA